jgi:hypothetical protein
MNKYSVRGEVKRFEGQYGWHYVELSEQLSNDFRPLIKNRWPALLKATFKINSTRWESSIMPIKDGPLFIALPSKIRKAEGIAEGQNVVITFDLNL